jgi:hypothetical protein
VREKKQSFAGFTAGWDQLLAAVEANRADLPEIEIFRVQLEANLEDLRALHAQRATLQANALRVTQDLKHARDQGMALASRLREWVRCRYGIRNDKLIEFGIKPRRKRRSRGKPVEEGGEERAPRKPTEP